VVVCRAGYNTAYAAAASDRPVVFVPLANEGGEQPYRARRLADLERTGLVDENQADAVRHLAAALEAALKQEQAPRRLPFALDGARRAAEFLAGQLAG
jgi:predicted glycosyltransferase